MKRPAILILGAMLVLASCGCWRESKTEEAFNSLKLPATCVSGYTSMGGYGYFWFIDTDGKMVNVQGQGLYFKAGDALRAPGKGQP